MCLGVPGRITRIGDGLELPSATVVVAGVTRECCLAYLPEARVGDYVMIHLGFAITLLDEQAALESLALFEEIGALVNPDATHQMD